MNAEEQEDYEDRGGDLRGYIDTRGHWLDYTIKQQFDNTAPPERLMRFMPLEQFLANLTTREIYIPRATEYDDPYDCAFPDSLSDEIREELLASCDEPEFSIPSDADHYSFVRQAENLLDRELREQFADEIAERWFVSCWHAGEEPTDLMWRSYGGHKGVCITCDGPALLKQLKDTVWVKRGYQDRARGPEHFEFLYGFVDYERPLFDIDVDEFAGPVVKVTHAAFRKHRFFHLDQEFRFAAKLTSKDASQYSAGAALDLATCNASARTSPLCPLWIAKSLERVTQEFYPEISIQHMSLESD
jgi:hypothetical protein